MYLLDTVTVSALRTLARQPAAVQDWARRLPVADCRLSAVTVLELDLGRLRVARRDAAQGDRLSAWIDRIVDAYPVLAVDLAVARRAATLHSPDPRPERDALIAATALVHGLTVVTRNVRDFEPTGVPLLNPWAAESLK